MNNFLRTVELLALSLWLGSDAFLSFVVAPGAFHILSSRDQAGAMVGFALTRMHLGGLLCGGVFLVARILRARTASRLGTLTAFRFLAGPTLCVVAMMILTAISQYTVGSKMAEVRVRMGSIQATDVNSPLLAEFTRLHRISVTLESGVLLAGVTAIYLLVREGSVG